MKKDVKYYQHQFVDRHVGPNQEELSHMLHTIGVGSIEELIDLSIPKSIQSKEKLLLLKGIGDYTSSAIASIAFNKPTPVIDGNVKRIMSRLLLLPDFKKRVLNKIKDFQRNYWKYTRHKVQKQTSNKSRKQGN